MSTLSASQALPVPNENHQELSPYRSHGRPGDLRTAPKRQPLFLPHGAQESQYGRVTSAADRHHRRKGIWLYNEGVGGD